MAAIDEMHLVEQGAAGEEEEDVASKANGSEAKERKGKEHKKEKDDGDEEDEEVKSGKSKKKKHRKSEKKRSSRKRSSPEEEDLKKEEEKEKLQEGEKENGLSKGESGKKNDPDKKEDRESSSRRHRSSRDDKERRDGKEMRGSRERSPPRRRPRSRSRSPRYRSGRAGSSYYESSSRTRVRRRSPTPPRVRERRRSRSRERSEERRRRARSSPRDRRRRARSDSSEHSRERSRSSSSDRRSNSKRSKKNKRDSDEKKDGEGEAASGAPGSGDEKQKEEEEEPQAPGVVDVIKETTPKGPLPTLQTMIKENPGMGVVKALQRIEEIKQQRSLASQAQTQAQALMQANLAAAGQAAQMAASSMIPSAALTKPARELYVGNLPPGTQVPQLADFLIAAMTQMKLISTTAAAGGSPILNAWLSPDTRFAFVEFRSIEEATNALALNNITIAGASQLKVGRPKEYQGSYLAMANTGVASSSFAMTAPPTPASTVATLAPKPPVMGLGAGHPSLLAAVTAAQSNYLMLMNIPGILGEHDVKELLRPFGDLKSFNMLKDREGRSKGIAIFEYSTRAQTEVALKGLSGLEIGDKRLSIQEIPTGQANMLLRPIIGPGAVVGGMEEGAAGASAVLRLQNMLTAEMDAEEVQEIKDEVTDECRKYGNVVEVVVSGEQQLIFVEFGDSRAAKRARGSLSGRSFDGRTVAAEYYPHDAFKNQNLTADPLEDKEAVATAAKEVAAGEEADEKRKEEEKEREGDTAQEDPAQGTENEEEEKNMSAAPLPPGPVGNDDLD